MERPSRPPLPWEQKAAISALALISLQELHEVLVISLGNNTLGLAHLQVLAPILLPLFLAAGYGLLKRSRDAWWWTMFLMTGAALFHLLIYWYPVKNSLQPMPQRIASLMEYEWLTPGGLSRFGLFWVISRQIFLTACPALLALGALRQSFRSS